MFCWDNTFQQNKKSVVTLHNYFIRYFNANAWWKALSQEHKY